MAVLTTTDRADATLKMIRQEIVFLNQTATLDTVQMRGLVDAMDDYIEANASAINTNIPQPLRGNASAKMKALAMAYAALKRAQVL